MHELTSYLLEFLSNDVPALEDRFNDASKVVRDWLQDNKHGETQDGSGSFISKSDKEPGRLLSERFTGASGIVDHYRLEETSFDGFLFATDLSLLRTPTAVKVYATVSAEDADDQQRRLPTPRCPGAVRRLLARFPDWTCRGYALGQGRLTRLSGSDVDVARLVALVEEPDRAHTIVLVSRREGELAIRDIDVKLANELTGLAKVYSLDEKASAQLTVRVGRLRSCYGGAVRLYWPDEMVADRAAGHVWLGEPLSMTPAPVFLEIVRRKVMFMATLLTHEPSELSAIRAEMADGPFSAERTALIDRGDAAGLVALYEGPLQRQGLEIDRKEAALRGLRGELAEMLGTRPAEYLPQASEDRLALRTSSKGAVPISPEPGEIRHYKKLYSNGAADTLIAVKGCSHNAWQDSHGADKARKGIAKLEGRSDWRGLQHCARCTGGGMWRVRW